MINKKKKEKKKQAQWRQTRLPMLTRTAPNRKRHSNVSNDMGRCRTRPTF